MPTERQRACDGATAGLLTLADTAVDLVADLSREQLALLVEDELRRALDVIEIALRAARLRTTQLHAVLLSGGGARLPLWADLVASRAVMRPLPVGTRGADRSRGGAAIFELAWTAPAGPHDKTMAGRSFFPPFSGVGLPTGCDSFSMPCLTACSTASLTDSSSTSRSCPV